MALRTKCFLQSKESYDRGPGHQGFIVVCGLKEVIRNVNQGL